MMNVICKLRTLDCENKNINTCTLQCYLNINMYKRCLFEDTHVPNTLYVNNLKLYEPFKLEYICITPLYPTDDTLLEVVHFISYCSFGRDFIGKLITQLKHAAGIYELFYFHSCYFPFSPRLSAKILVYIFTSRTHLIYPRSQGMESSSVI